MNTRKLLLTTLITVIAIVLLIAGSASAQASESTFTCTDEGYNTTDIGTWSFPDGNIHIRGMKQTAHSICDDPRVTGYNYITVNANWDANYTGPIWGTFTLQSDAGGTWIGTWN